MSTSTLNAQTRGFGLSVAITSILSALLVIVKETNDGLMNFMKHVTVHHWVTHGIFDVAVFVILGLLLAKSNNGQGPDIDDEKFIKVVVGGFLLGCLTVAAFYLIHG
jgi:nitric oxide reductase large subunit